MTMLMPVVMTPDLLQDIVAIGDARLPNEACGVMIPTQLRGSRVFEVPNRSKRPADSFAMHSDDIVLILEDWLLENPGKKVWEQVSIWHTHPSGRVGPSKQDLDNRIEKCGNLVVSLGVDPRATWY